MSLEREVVLPRTQLLGIQYLRAIAALMVAVFHLPGQFPPYTEFFRGSLIGNLDFARGVDIFFVISGFIMVVSNRRTPPGRFLVKRIIRVAPLYWVLTTLLVFLDFLLPNEFRTTEVSPAAYFKSLLFIPYCNAGHSGEVFPPAGPGLVVELRDVFLRTVFGDAQSWLRKFAHGYK